jgi:hypothetical protein
MLAVAIYYTLGNRNEVETKVAEVRETELKKQVSPVEVKTPSKVKKSEPKSQTTVKSEDKQPLKQATLVPKKSVRRPSFYVKHRGLKPQDCNLAYRDTDEVTVPTNMQIHDYFKWSDNQYYFAVSTGARKFLLKAKDIAKEECSKSDLTLAFKFAKYCKAKDQPEKKVASGNVNEQKSDASALTSKELAHVNSQIKSVPVPLKDCLAQKGRELIIVEQEAYQVGVYVKNYSSRAPQKKVKVTRYRDKVTARYYLMDTIHDFRSSSTGSSRTTRSLSYNKAIIYSSVLEGSRTSWYFSREKAFEKLKEHYIALYRKK